MHTSSTIEGASGASSRPGAGAGLQDGFIEIKAGKRRLGTARTSRLPLAGIGGLGALVGILGCGQQYRPVVSAVNPVGPAGQPTKYAIAVSSPSPTSAGLITLVDFSGDTIVGTQPILPNPTYLALPASGAQAYAINASDSLTEVPDTTVPNSLQTNLVIQTTLPTGAAAPALSVFTLGGTSRLLVPESGRSSVAILTAASPALQQEITVGANPDYVVGVDGTPRAYVLSTGTVPGQAAAIEGNNLGVSATINVGTNPVYGVETADLRRAFIMNAGSGTVSVINVTNNALDAANPTITVGQNPVWADLATVTNELVVLNGGDGMNPGSLSIINIPLCSVIAQPTNPACDPANPVDGAGFGDVIATVPVGVNPQQVAVLADGSRAYVVNRGRLPSGNDPGVDGSISVVNLATGKVTATIPAAAGTAANPTSPTTSATSVLGHPTTIAVTNGTPTGKAYVTSSDSRYMTVIETDTDTVDTQINLQGLGVRVRVTNP